ncbi:MAG TPA: amino acid adenylation domain-containing protein, partial [Candidatus Deferrimicrobium sp.]|nr:amino acid adenylation domain-containing protein [Candidatus Deferrimicrobium sp.]
YYDLSYAQRRLWIICQFEEDSIAYNEVGGLTIKGKFEPKAFEQALQTIAQRHESLRTVFVTIDGEPKQKILPHVELKLEQEDLRHLKGDRQKNEVSHIIKNTANKAFNLEKGPLAIFKLLHLEEETYFLVVNIHHIINDGGSVLIIKRELNVLYNFFHKNIAHPKDIRSIPLAPIYFQYKDYTLWHNRLIVEGYFDKFKDYWLEKFKDKPNGIELPLDHPRGAVQTFNGGRIYYKIGEAETRKLRDLADGENTTLFMKLISLLSILLHKYSGENDIIMGSPIANRKQPELHNIIGFLVNTLVYRLPVEPGVNFGQLLARVKEETLACYENQDFPFDILVENLGLTRDMSRSPLFNVMISYADVDTNSEYIQFDWAEVTFHDQVEGFNPSVFDLVFIFNEKETQFDCEIMYNCDLFEKYTVKRMANNFLTLVKKVLENTTKPISDLEYIEKEEYQTIVHHFNNNNKEFLPLTIQELVERQVEKSLHHIAVVSPKGWSITYDEINKKANQLAHYLQQEYAIGRGKVIGICMERSLEMVIAVLGVIKSGGAYLSFDPTYPKDRVQHMIADSRADLVIIDRPRPESFENKQTMLLFDTINSRACLNPGIRNNLSDAVYVIYTSGSTGTPNGAILSHALLSNLIQWQAKNTGIDGSLRCLQFTSINFCVSFQEIFTTLSSGGEVHLIGDIERQDITYLMEYLVRRKIGNLYLPFSYLNFLFNLYSETAKPTNTYLKHIITAGEQLKITGGLKKFLELNPGIKLHNHYGSSEMHVVTSFTLDAAAASLMPVPPAGKPIANTRIYILDENEKAVPIGVWGELFVDGGHEVLGYIHNPVLTGKKLLWHPAFSLFSGHRLYRSGDVGRWLPDGNIELKGRKDFQVKIRGFRVELSEIESKILSFDKVKDCVVVVRENTPGGEKKLVAYVVAHDFDVMELKRHLGNYLPQYMIPHFIVLENLPLMPNGKVDRDRLPVPGSTAGKTGEEIPPVPQVQISRINELLRECSTPKPGASTPTGLEPMIAHLTQFLMGRVLPDRARISHIDIDIFRGIENGQAESPRFFEQQAAQTPDAAAVVTQNNTITYHELNRRANHLASLLHKKGISRNANVGLMVAPSLEMIINILGILKAGCNYISIAPNMSTDGIITMLENHQVQILLTSGKDLGKHPFALLQGVDNIVQPPSITAPRPQIMDFDSLPIPDRSLVSYEKYNRHIGLGMVKNTITLQATRGCPYNCLYCHKIWPKKHVFRSAENVFNEVEHYYKLGVRRFVFADDIFNLDNTNSRRFFELVVKNKLDINIFFPNGLRSDLLTPDYMDLMVEAGLAGLGMALETASPRLQKLIRKHLHLEKLRENIEYFCRHHPQVILELFTMHGFPTESEEEAMMTFDFVKNRHWLDFPYLLILKIYPNTDMASLALEKGIPQEAITRSAHMAYHELPETLPFDKAFTLKYQSDFANEYFLLKERLLAKMPYQMKVMTADEMVEKYNSYLPIEIKTFAGMLDFLKLRPEELGLQLDENGYPLPETYPLVRQGIKPQNLDAGIRQLFGLQKQEPFPGALRILLLDLSQFFSNEREMLYDGVEPPLGLMALLTYLKRELGAAVNGRIAKARVDFDKYNELKKLINDFKPQVIGIRTLSHHRDFFHKTVSLVRQWGIEVPIIAGGPYATSDCAAILQDRHINLAVLSEGELTFTELIREMLKNNGQIPGLEILAKIPGIAFIPQTQANATAGCRDIILTDGLDDDLAGLAGERENDPKPERIGQYGWNEGQSLPEHPAVSLVFGSSAYSYYRILKTLALGGSLCIAPETLNAVFGVNQVTLMEFYLSKNIHDTHTKESAFNIRLELQKNSPLLRKKRFDNDVEEKLAEIWSELLDIDKNMIDKDDNFFELGGHSLKAATMITRIHKNFNSSIKLIEIFKAPTLRGISQLIQSAAISTFNAISPAETREYYPLSAAQKRMYILQQMELESIVYNMPQAFVIHNLDPAQLEKLKLTFKKLVDRHESLRTSFHIINAEPVQRIHDRVDFEIEYYNIDTAVEKKKRRREEDEKIRIEDFVRNFDLTKAPLIRVFLAKRDDEKHLLVVDMHHIISDGVSVQVLVRDFRALFAGTKLEPLHLHYKDFSQWQNNETEQAAIKQQGNYWRQQLDGEIIPLNLPTDYTRPAVQSFAGDEIRFEIEIDAAAALINLALEQGTTLYMILISLYTILLANLSGQEDIIVGTPVAGRKHADIERIIGMFVNTLPLRYFPVGDRPFKEFLAEVKQRTLEAFANQDYPYEALVDELKLERDVSRNPLFDTVFVMQNTDRPDINIPGLELET